MTADDDRALTRDHFDHVSRVTTRWADNDMYGHLNNAVYYELFDSAINALVIAAGDARRDGAHRSWGSSPSRGAASSASWSTRARSTSGCGSSGSAAAASPTPWACSTPRPAEVAAVGHWVHVYIDRATRAPVPIPSRGARRAGAGRGTAMTRVRADEDHRSRAGGGRATRSLGADAARSRSASSTSTAPARVRCWCGSRPPGCATPTSPSSTATERAPSRCCSATRPAAGSRSSGPGSTDLAVGQRVVMTFLPRCGECAGCATGRADAVRSRLREQRRRRAARWRTSASRDGVPVHHHLGVSAFATHAVVDTRSVVAVDDDVPADVAAVLGCAVLTGGGALLNAAPPEPGQRVMVVGLGGVGMAALLTAVALGQRRRGRRRRGRRQARAGRGSARPRVLEPGELAAERARRDVVVEAAGNARAFEAALAATAPGGPPSRWASPTPTPGPACRRSQLVAEARTVIGSYLGSAVPTRDIPVFAQWWREGRLPVEALVSSRIALDDVNHAMDELAAGAPCARSSSSDPQPPPAAGPRVLWAVPRLVPWTRGPSPPAVGVRSARPSRASARGPASCLPCTGDRGTVAVGPRRGAVRAVGDGGRGGGAQSGDLEAQVSLLDELLSRWMSRRWQQPPGCRGWPPRWLWSRRCDWQAADEAIAMSSVLRIASTTNIPPSSITRCELCVRSHRLDPIPC